jgi:hypothetical protein
MGKVRKSCEARSAKQDGSAASLIRIGLRPNSLLTGKITGISRRQRQGEMRKAAGWRYFPAVLLRNSHDKNREFLTAKQGVWTPETGKR